MSSSLLSSDKQNYSLPAFQRLKKPAQFQSVYQSKQWGGSKFFTFNVLAKQETTDSACSNAVLGVTVSKKVSKRAVDRNRIKRQVREFFRHNKSELQNADLVITAKPSCIKASDHERYESLTELWTKVLKWQRWHKRQIENNKQAINT